MWYDVRLKQGQFWGLPLRVWADTAEQAAQLVTWESNKKVMIVVAEGSSDEPQVFKILDNKAFRQLCGQFASRALPKTKPEGGP